MPYPVAGTAGNHIERGVAQRETVPDGGALGGEMLRDEVRAAGQPPAWIGRHVQAGAVADPEYLAHEVEPADVSRDVGQGLEELGALEAAFGDGTKVQPGDREPGR